MALTLKCFIIDDEQPARAVLEKFIQRVPFLELVGQSYNAVEALWEIQQVQPDLILLDVEMPEMSGIEFLRTLSSPRPQVIMVTASPQYAVEGFELEVLDYLLKPVAFDRFLRAINKAVSKLQPSAAPIVSLPPLTPPPTGRAAELPASPNAPANFFLVKEDKKLIKVLPEEIVFVEAMKDYLTIYLPTRTIVTHMTMTKIEEMLPSADFLRVNRSYIVRKGAIREIDGNLITTTDGKRVPIGVTYRESVWKAMKENLM
ncbi:LytR/AlgR family response regulator transcription factor [Spirosoma agri]|jgi:DNA-binding LytR/AlgR family response regulator|uniref:Response regulator transcription factor n=1 Tax=Spirosoma agri TaxID=1987381 RepID=A0A6M0IN91_9BACT|nr:LytTR family DNA-binding domain-containing protein [Spirosoma agri]NEU69779.1 response regulator transcription factor [Spirosoma agri]